MPLSFAATVAHAFADAVNRRSPADIARLMTEDHVFIDSMGTRVAGKQAMQKGWQGYFSTVPDYSITVDQTFAEGPVVVMLGTAQGTWSSGGPLKQENRWQTPAAWRAVVRDSLIAEWRVYADNEPIRRIIARNSAIPAEPPANPGPAAP